MKNQLILIKFALLTTLWETVMKRFNTVSGKLQSEEMAIYKVVKWYNLLTKLNFLMKEICYLYL